MSKIKLRYLLILVLLVLLGIFLRLYKLGSESIWLDEAVSIQNTSLPFLQMIKAVIAHDGSPPFYFTLLWSWLRLFGKSEFAVRSLSAVLGIISIILMYKLGSLLLSKKEALLGTFIFTISKPPIWASQEARMYSVLILLVLTSSILFVNFCNFSTTSRKDTKLIISITFVNILITYTHIYGLFFVLSQVLYILFAERSKLKSFFLSCVFICICYIPWAIVLKSQVSAEYGNWVRGSWIGKLGRLGPYYIAWKLSSEHKILVAIFLTLTLVAIFFTFLKGSWGDITPTTDRHSKIKNVSFLLLWILTPIIIAYILSYLLRPFLDARYVFFVIPAYYLLISRGVFWFKNKTLQLFFVLGITLINIYCLYFYYTFPQKEQWRESVNFIQSSKLKADAIVLTGGIESFNYYYHGILPVENDSFALPTSQGLVITDSIKNRIANADAIWFLKSIYNNPELKLEEWIKENFYPKVSKKFYSIEVYYYIRVVKLSLSAER